MIVDSLSLLKQYETLNPLFAKACEYLATVDLTTLAEGRYEIDAERVFMLVVVDAPLKKREEASLEVHDRYIDIQIIVEGAESFGWRQRKLCVSPRSEMDRERDILFFDDTPSTYVTVAPNEFALFFPADAHAPLVGDGVVKKCIIKVLA